MSEAVFDELVDAYEAMIDWRKRLAFEEPFWRQLVERTGAKRVLDTACGTGHHGAMFHEWGLSVEAADVSPAMIARCRTLWGEKQGLMWVLRSFEQPATEGFDLALCVGNSLALAGSREGMGRAVGAMLGSVKPGGVLVVQVANLWRMAEGKILWQKCKRTRLGAKGSGEQREVLIHKGMHRWGTLGYVELLVTEAMAAEPAMKSESVRFWGVERAELEQMAWAGGAQWVETYGDYQKGAYEAEKSTDLLLVTGR